MIFKHLKIQDKNHSAKDLLSVFFKTALALIAGAFVIAIPMLLDHETASLNVPILAGAYSVTPLSCTYDPTSGTLVKFIFEPKGIVSSQSPAPTIKEIPEEGKTIVIFEQTVDLAGEFNYNDVIDNPLIELLEYRIKDGLFIVEISRRNAYLPAKVVTDGKTATIILSNGNTNYPLISNQKPAHESAAFPAKHPISFTATLTAPLRDAYVIFNEKPTVFSTEQTATSTYDFFFEKELQIDTEYVVKTIITDNDGRTTIASWKFTGQIPSAAILGKDRFKYLGWWGQIAASGVTVRQGPSTTSEKIGSLSSAERVKVLEEVFGDWVDGKNLWYRIDGGKYAGSYLFSDYVTPMAQPEPPAEFKIPEGVLTDENWIDVDLTKKVLTLFKYDKPLFSTYIASGRAENPTQNGTYRIWYKLEKTDMQGGPPLHTYRYHLKDIPWTMFYNYDYAIHGTYWHDKFGTQQSAGCTNMTKGDAKYIFDNVLPDIPEGKGSVFSRGEDGKGTGTVVFNHE